MARFTAEALRRYCGEVLKAEGLSGEDAALVADCLVDADLCGVDTHGVSRMGIYVQRLRAGVVGKENRVQVVSEHPSAIALDAHNTMGMVAAKEAMERCVEKARVTGCCWATVRGSNHFGAAAYYTKLAAAAGMAGFAFTNLIGKIAPWGACEPYMGTNPISIAVPSLDRPVVLDMAPSVVALGKLILAEKQGRPIPEGWALDARGRPTTDPAAGRKGTLVPIGGPKGSGLAIFVDILCGVLSGGEFGPHLHDLYGDMEHPQGVGHAFCAVDISKFIDLELFKARVSQMSAEIKALGRVEGCAEIFMPGEIEQRHFEERAAEGIELSDAVRGELSALGLPHGIVLQNTTT